MAYNLGPVKPQTAKAVAILGPKFHIGTVYGYANRNIGGTSVKSDHAYGLAADFMCSIPTGNMLAAYAKAHAAQLDVKYIIHNRKIWSVARSAEGWRAYSGSSPHTDHVHISFNGSGAVTDPGGSVTLPDVAGQGANAVGAAYATPTAFGGVGALYNFLTTPGIWLRVAMFIGGLFALILGLTTSFKTLIGG